MQGGIPQSQLDAVSPLALETTLQFACKFSSTTKRVRLLTYRRSEGRPDLKKNKIYKILIDQNLPCSNYGEGDHDQAQAENTDQTCFLLQ